MEPEAVAQVRLYVCDEAREEINSKLSLLGFYPDNVVILYRAAAQPGIDSKSSAAGVGRIERLTLLVCVTGLVGDHDAVVTLFDEPGKPKGPPIAVRASFGDGSRSWNFLAKVQPFLVKAFGAQYVRLTIDGREYDLTFDIRDGGILSPRRDAAPTLPSPPKPIARKQAKPRPSR